MPFILKAGTIGKLEVKLNYLTMATSFFTSSDSGQAEVIIDDLSLVLAPILSSGNMESEFRDQPDANKTKQPYTEDNCHNIFNSNLQLRRKGLYGNLDLCWEKDLS